MHQVIRILRKPTAYCRINVQQISQVHRKTSRRRFHATSPAKTDGVYHELTAMRVRTPFVEALRHQQRPDANKNEPSPPPPAERDLSPKKMADSYHRLILPIGQDPWLLDNYLNSSGHIRLGTLLMDLDALSGVVAYKHTGESVMTVTAAVDRIQMRQALHKICDLELSGQVTFATGRSSMEISMQVARASADGSPAKDSDVLVTCAFTMVSLDPSTKKPVNIAPLQVDTAEERALYEVGRVNYESKKALSKRGLRKTAPNGEESELIHAMWLRQLAYRDPEHSAEKPENMTYMETTRIHNAQIMQPQYRNRHNFMIFGGYLLKQTFELAFCSAAAFSHSRPIFLSLDPSTFENPVPVGSVLYLTATVAYTEKVEGKTSVQIRVDSRVRNVEHGETKPTGQFNYTFLVDKDIQVMPRTYSEFMIWTDAKRRAQHINDSVAKQDQMHSPILKGG